jgi:hypothetical protein
MPDQLNGAYLRNVVTESGFFIIRDERKASNQEGMSKAVRKVAEGKTPPTPLASDHSSPMSSTPSKQLSKFSPPPVLQ